MTAPVYESVAAVALIFVLPGFALSRAVFPEWRFRGPNGAIHVIETAALALVLSVAMTILVGFALVNAPGAGFSADWSNPILEIILVGITVIALIAAYLRGAFAKTPPEAAAPSKPSLDWATLRKLDKIAREQGHLRRALRRARDDPEEYRRVEARLQELENESELVKRRREADFGD